MGFVGLRTFLNHTCHRDPHMPRLAVFVNIVTGGRGGGGGAAFLNFLVGR